MKIMAIDPGLKGAIVVLSGLAKTYKLGLWKMPLGEPNSVNYAKIWRIINSEQPDHIFLERAVSFGMGTKGAFNYGRSFAAVEIAIGDCSLPVTYVEPAKWAKEIHAGIQKDLKPKAKSLIAVNRLFPKLVAEIERDKKGNLHDGQVDALLIAEYGRRTLTELEGGF